MGIEIISVTILGLTAIMAYLTVNASKIEDDGRGRYRLPFFFLTIAFTIFTLFTNLQVTDYYQVNATTGLGYNQSQILNGLHSSNTAMGIIFLPLSMLIPLIAFSIWVVGAVRNKKNGKN